MSATVHNECQPHPMPGMKQDGESSQSDWDTDTDANQAGTAGLVHQENPRDWAEARRGALALGPEGGRGAPRGSKACKEGRGAEGNSMCKGTVV